VVMLGPEIVERSRYAAGIVLLGRVT